MPDGEIILIVGAMLAAGLLASLFADRVRVPALVLFLGAGMLIGSDALGLVEFSNYELARTIGIVALALILFEGGLASGFEEIRPVLRPSIDLAIVGTILTALIAGFAASLLFDFSTLEGLLLGSILAATDAAAVFALLRGSTLRRRVARTLEGESGMNDPVAVLLVLGFIEWIQKPDYGLLDMGALFVVQITVGTAVGLGVGWVATQALRRMKLASSGLYPVASIAAAAIAFGAADVMQGSGFLAVYLVGLVLGSAAIPAKRTISAFHDGLAWIAQLVLFFTLGLLVFPSQLGGVWVEATVLTLVLVFVARPIAVLVSTAFDRFSIRERAVIGFAGMRGAVPVVLATFPVIKGIQGSFDFFNIVFFVVLISTVLQGTLFEPFARRMRVTTSEPALPRSLVESGTIRRLGADLFEYPVRDDDAIVGHRIRDLGLPREALVTVIVRNHNALPPRGSTTIEAGDQLHVLVRRELAGELPALAEWWRRGPVGTG